MSKLLHRSLEAKLAALDGPEWDSSDDEKDTEQKTKTTKTKKSTKTQKQITPSKTSSKKDDSTTTNTNTQIQDKSSNVIYLGHIPPAFEETQILTFFSQFGKVQNVKLSRSKRTGTPRGYAFIEFQELEVAAIVADTMNGYFLKGERRLVCHILPKEKVHPKLFQGAKRNLQLSQSDVTTKERIGYWYDKEREKVNKDRSMEGIQKITKRLLSRERKKRKQLERMGIEYDFPGYAASYETVQKNNASGEEEHNEKKRKASVDDAETEDDEVPPTTNKTKKLKKEGKKKVEVETKVNEVPPPSSKKKKKPKKITKITSTPIVKRKLSSDTNDEINEKRTSGTPKPKKKVSAKVPMTEIKKKKKSGKKRRKSVE